MHNDLQFYPEGYSVQKKSRRLVSLMFDVRERICIGSAAEAVVIMLANFILVRAGILEGLYPFGAALFIASAANYRKLIYPLLAVCILGAVTGLNGYGMWESILIFSISTCILQLNIFKKRRIALALTALFLTVLVKTLSVLIGQPVVYAFIRIIVESLLVGGLTYAFMTFFTAVERVKTERTSLTAEEVVCSVILITGILLGLQGINFGDISVTGILSCFVILSTAYIAGGGTAAGMGALMGMLPNLTVDNNTLILSLYAFSGLSGGLFRHLGKAGIGAGFLVGHLIFAAYFIDPNNFISYLSEMLIAVTLFWVCPNGFYRLLSSIIEDVNVGKGNSFSYEVMVEKLKKIEQIFHELGRTFVQTGAALDMPGNKSDIDNIDLMLTTITSNVCSGCSIYKTCWQTEVYRTYHEILELFAKLEESGRLSEKDLKGVIARRCRREKELIATLNCLWDICRVNSFWNKKLQESRDLVASQLHGVGDIVSGLVSQTETWNSSDENLEAEIYDILSRNGFNIEDIGVYKKKGAYQCTIKKKACQNNMECYKYVLPLVEETLGCKLSQGRAECGLETSTPSCRVTFMPKKILDVDLGVAQETEYGSAVSGDSYSTVLLEDSGKMALILSDGMGTGARAAQESSATVNLLKQLLETGFEKNLAVKTVNASLALRCPDETFSTVDLALIDLYRGDTDFIKIAAVPSYIQVEGELKLITSNSLPIGILDTVDFEPVTCNLKQGDIIIMVSDGVTEAAGRDKEHWIAEELKKVSREAPQNIADHLLQKAKDFSMGKPADDMLVMAAKLTAYSEYY